MSSLKNNVENWLQRRKSRRSNNNPDDVHWQETPGGGVVADPQYPLHGQGQQPSNPGNHQHGQQPSDAQPHQHGQRPPHVQPPHHAPHPRTGDGQEPAAPQMARPTAGNLRIVLRNNTDSNQVYAYITGQAIDNNNALFLLLSDAHTPYYPPNVSATGVPISPNISIHLGAPGSSVTATIPYLAGARIWFSIGEKLSFFVNPGPGMVEPSIFNSADPNAHINFGFCEFTYSSSQLFANITNVDFVSGIPIALTLQDVSGAQQKVLGMPADGLDKVCAALRAQSAKDGKRWSSLIVKRNGRNLRCLSPNSSITLDPSLFSAYWTDYVNQVYSEYQSKQLIVDTQSGYGNVAGQVNSSGVLDFGSGGAFPKPSAADIFSNSTGVFSSSNPETLAIIPRLAAAFNRSTLLLSNNTPNGTRPNQFYKNPTTNHYARIVHDTSKNGTGYAFPFDDVIGTGEKPQEGAVFSSTPAALVVTVGGHT